MISLILAGLVSADWQPLPSAGSAPLRSLYGVGDTLVACGTSGCALAMDRGAKWTPPVNHVPFEGTPVRSGAIFAAPAQQVIRSSDLGRTWSAWNEGVASNLSPEAVAIQGSRAFLSAYKVRANPGLTIYTDTCVWFVREGESATKWTTLDSANTSNCADIAIGYEGRLFRTAMKVSQEGGTTRLVESSSDLGKNWTTIREGASLKVFHDGTLALNGVNGDSSLLSLDSGRTWKHHGFVYSQYYLDGAILPEGSEDWIDLRSGGLRTFDIDSLDKVVSWARTGRVLWAQGTYGLFSSTDSGRNWIRSDRNSPLGTQPTMRWHDGSLYATLFLGKRYVLARSTDDGKTWKHLTQPSRGIGRLESCGGNLMAEEYGGTLVASGESVSVLDMAQSVAAITCLGSKAYGLEDGELASWNGVNWSRFGDAAFEEPMDLAATPEGFFAKIDDWENETMRMDFIANGASVVEKARIDGYVKNIAGSPRGAWASTPRGLYRCTDAQHCTNENPMGSDSLWAFSSVNIQGPFALVSAIRYGLDLRYDYDETRLFASRDSGKTWTTLPTPFAAQAAAVTPSGIVASLHGAGLWLLPSDTFRVTGVSPSLPSRHTRPTFEARGRILSITGVSTGARLRIVDAAGRVVLDARPEVRDGAATATLPPSARGVLFAEMVGSGSQASFRWVNSER